MTAVVSITVPIESTEPCLKATSLPEYRVWASMNGRCHSPSGLRNKSYGGRGIRVCDEWRGPGGFEVFYEHIGPRPTPKHEIDRIDNDGHYEPGNVRWVTRSEQLRNRRAISPETYRERAGALRLAAQLGAEFPESMHTPWQKLQAATFRRNHPARVAMLRQLWEVCHSLYGDGWDQRCESFLWMEFEEKIAPARRGLQRAPQTLSPSEAGELGEDYEQRSDYGRTMALHSDGCTLEEVGQALGVTRERARQIEEAALRKLRTALLKLVPAKAALAFRGDLKEAYVR